MSCLHASSRPSTHHLTLDAKLVTSRPGTHNPALAPTPISPIHSLTNPTRAQFCACPHTDGQAIRPGTLPVGLHKGEPYYPRQDLSELHTTDRWRREGWKVCAAHTHMHSRTHTHAQAQSQTALQCIYLKACCHPIHHHSLLACWLCTSTHLFFAEGFLNLVPMQMAALSTEQIQSSPERAIPAACVCALVTTGSCHDCAPCTGA